ncbi:type II and III secretion system protein family protein [Raoultella planticola]|uniref:type II and III secretion system protein family protein n=1 Tax=Raoultella planticola TaxID=575 RepID=UPI001A2398BE|nr:pilus assembly protein N-terminal domain-containing protein [Raoultella planticola]EJR0220672.1 pilus assembly protein N-terminal domain-containing protein [Raoultella planticola]EJR0350486.1 pilus assembly protein N-terminal domain-containing protein [Raoultella planticola]MDV1446378.1 pilus assembly protein N-terminal domain-containing protein [Raoultella planticola]MDV1565341.1 pilus assembly protein N-terminal domain-containing protein [Raoultella planticola]MDV1572633.1 pilus assembly 
MTQRLYCIKRLFVLLVFCTFSLGAWAEVVNLKPGQSKTLRFASAVNTVFVSDPAVADYKIVNDKNIVLYARKLGSTELVVYGAQAKILMNLSVDVDPFLSDIRQRVAREFPGSAVEVKRFLNADKATWILSGTVADEETRDGVYQLVGSLVGDGGGGKSSGDSDSNKGPRFAVAKVYDNVINRLQLPSSNQVNVKLTVVEVSKEFTDNLGIEWSSLTLDSIISSGSSVNSPGMFNLLGFRRGFDAANISTLINAVKNDAIARVLAQPNLTVLSGESASFLVGGEIPIMVKDQDSVTVQYKEYGIRLNITAKVEKRQKIRLYVSNELSSVTGSYAYNDYQIPTMRTRRSSSTIELADGDSFVIGGLLSEADKESLTKVPFIGDIPVLGALARSSMTERSKSELVVFATVNLVKPQAEAAARKMSLPSFRRSSVEKLFFNVGVDQKMREDRLNSDAGRFLEQGGFAR